MTRPGRGPEAETTIRMRMFRWWRGGFALLATLLLFCLVWLPSAAAQEEEGGPTPALFLLPTQGVRDSVTTIVPERIGELNREQVDKDDRVELMPPYKELRQQLGGSSAAVAQAESMYTSGIGLLTAGEDKKAADTFQRAVDMMEQNIGDMVKFGVLADSLANLSLAYFNAGFDLDARKRMQAYAHLRPGAELDPEKYPKELISIFQDEAKKVKSAGPGKLEIKASDDALVFIDGVEKGTTPLTVEDVGFGHHYLVVRGSTGGVWTEKIRVRGRNKTQAFEVELSGAPKASAESGGEPGAMPTFYTDLLEQIRTGEIGTDLGPYLKELASQTGAASIAWVAMFKENSEYVAAAFAYRAADGMIVRGENIVFNLELSNLVGGVSKLSSEVVELALTMPEDQAVTSVQLVEPPAEVASSQQQQTDVEVRREQETGDPIEAPPKVPPSQARNTWTYVGITAGGIAVLGLVAGGIYLLSDDPSPSTDAGFNTEVSW